MTSVRPVVAASRENATRRASRPELCNESHCDGRRSMSPRRSARFGSGCRSRARIEATGIEEQPAADGPTTKKVSPQEFKALMTKVLRSVLAGTATTAEQQRFWQAARTTDLVNDTIKALEAQVNTNPQDAEARMELADAYVAKLLTVPAGPERGLWGMKAEKQWRDIVKQDQDHWEAQFTLSYGYSMYPEFLNKTDDAIAGLEKALKIQERVQPKAEHAKTYVQLARMYKRKRNTEKVREILELGRARHPRNDEITKALQALQDQ